MRHSFRKLIISKDPLHEYVYRKSWFFSNPKQNYKFVILLRALQHKLIPPNAFTYLVCTIHSKSLYQCNKNALLYVLLGEIPFLSCRGERCTLLSSCTTVAFTICDAVSQSTDEGIELFPFVMTSIRLRIHKSWSCSI